VSEVVAVQGVTVLLSSHLVADLERVCDYLVLLVTGRVALNGDVETLLGSHHRLADARRDTNAIPPNQTVIEESHVEKQSTPLVRTDEPILDPAWTVTPVTLDDLVLAYMRQARDGAATSATKLAVPR
jgi:ABC-2 type transport system ATP-binding protein